MEVVDRTTCLFRYASDFCNTSGLCIEFACERFLAILDRHGIAAFGIGRDVDVEAHDVACIDGFLIDDFARLVSNAYLIGIVERIEVNP